ncbi:hypothetical protein [Micromonospora sp. CA-246542]|uniref:hypothetical protein n=1 Tax=Micromonospora sp. CA-246542 TaxID=3239959 RepID=UPI003D92FA3B
MEVKRMATDSRRSRVALLHGVALLVAALGIVVEYLVGVPGFPKIPPGPIILGLASILVLAVGFRWRWIFLISLLVALFVTVGGAIEGSSWGRLGEPGDFGPWIGTVIQWIGLAAAVVTGVIIVAGLFRRRPALPVS